MSVPPFVLLIYVLVFAGLGQATDGEDGLSKRQGKNLMLALLFLNLFHFQLAQLRKLRRYCPFRSPPSLFFPPQIWSMWLSAYGPHRMVRRFFSRSISPKSFISAPPIAALPPPPPAPVPPVPPAPAGRLIPQVLPLIPSS
jgi:hypothetical protein